jgi:hypothetical protein
MRITTLIRRHTIIPIRPRRSGTKEKRSDDGECGGYAAHATSIAEPKKNAHMRPGQLGIYHCAVLSKVL